MSQLKYYAYPGWGPVGQKELHYSQAVRIGDRIECSGQGTSPIIHHKVDQMLIDRRTGGWDPDLKTGAPEFPKDLNEEIDQAFKNVDLCLRDAGGKGWSQVFRVMTYLLDIPASHDRIVENYRKWMPDHCPIWTELGVKELGAPDMRIEIEVVAYDPK